MIVKAAIFGECDPEGVSGNIMVEQTVSTLDASMFYSMKKCIFHI